MTDKTLTGKQKRHLRALAHHIKPVVQVGNKGLTDAVIVQVTEQLQVHELIKVKLGQDCPVGKKEAGAGIESGTGAHVVQIMGRTVTVFKQRDKDSEITLPKPS